MLRSKNILKRKKIRRFFDTTMDLDESEESTKIDKEKNISETDDTDSDTNRSDRVKSQMRRIKW